MKFVIYLITVVVLGYFFAGFLNGAVYVLFALFDRDASVSDAFFRASFDFLPIGVWNAFFSAILSPATFLIVRYLIERRRRAGPEA